jgi:hypothetical protein
MKLHDYFEEKKPQRWRSSLQIASSCAAFKFENHESDETDETIQKNILKEKNPKCDACCRLHEVARHL